MNHNFYTDTEEIRRNTQAKTLPGLGQHRITQIFY